MKYTHRYLARVIVEASTPLAVGSGERNIMTDRLVTTDVNGLPFIPGTALAGVLRHSFRRDLAGKLFGKQEIINEKGKEINNSEGSRIILSSAHITGKDGKVKEGLLEKVFEDNFLKNFRDLPIRQHVRISHRGASEKRGKFDEQIVFKGTRFCFMMEFIGDKSDETCWNDLLKEFSRPTFRIGGGSRKGFGEISVEEIKNKAIDLEKELDKYLSISSSLNDPFWDTVVPEKPEKENTDWIIYRLSLKPDDFLLFGSGFGTDEADMGFVTERVITWDKAGSPEFSEEKILMLAASVKGAISHRVAFHFNKLNEVYADKIKEPGFCHHLISMHYSIPEDCREFDSGKTEDILKMIADGNPAIRSLFGYSASDNDGRCGNVIFSDVFLKPARKKLLTHVAIDRFTGGAIDGALFSEEVACCEETFEMSILVNKDAFITENVKTAFEKTLNDLCAGKLPLGGGTMRGHGCFSGSFITEEGGI